MLVACNVISLRQDESSSERKEYAFGGEEQEIAGGEEKEVFDEQESDCVFTGAIRNEATSL